MVSSLDSNRDVVDTRLVLVLLAVVLLSGVIVLVVTLWLLLLLLVVMVGRTIELSIMPTWLLHRLRLLVVKMRKGKIRTNPVAVVVVNWDVTMHCLVILET